MSGQKDILLQRIREHGEFTRGEMLSLIARLSVPSILAQITSTLLFFIDAAMVGSLGAESSAAIGLVESSTWLFGSFTGAASMGFSVQIAHRVGAGDFPGARGVVRQALVSCALFSSFVAMVGAAISPFLPTWLGGGADIAPQASVYFAIFVGSLPLFQIYNLSMGMLKSTGNMKVPSIVSVMMCVLDGLFNYLFIFQFHLGVTGAALGTALAIAVSSIVITWFALVRSDALRLSHEPGRWIPQRHVLRKALSISAPMALQYVLMNGAQIVSTIIVAPLGTIAIAAHSLASTAESLCYMPGHGVGEAATTLVGQSLGAGEHGLQRSFGRLSVLSGMVVMAFMGLVMYIFAPELMSLMTPVEAIRQLGADCLRIEAWAEPWFAAAIVSYACFVGAGDTFRPACINLATMWGIRLTLAAILAPHYGLQGVWVAMALELTCRGLLLMWRLFRQKCPR